MRVALVVHDFDSNYGQGRYCVELARRLRHRCELTVYANTHKPSDIPEGVRCVHVPAMRSHASFTVFSFIPASERLIGGGGHDIVHAQGLSCWTADVITGHICNAARLLKMPRRPWRSSLFIRLVKPFERAFYRQKNARRVIAISRALAAEVERFYGWRKPIDVIYHGTDTQQFRPANDEAERAVLRQRFGLPDGRWMWMFAGEAVKGLRQAIEHLPEFPEAHLFVLTRSRLEVFKALAQRLGVLDRITFWGFEPQPELAYRVADLFVYANDYDPFGMVAAEAVSSGVPILCGKQIGVAELIDHGRNGLLCDPDDFAEISRHLHWIAALPDRGRSLGLAGREVIRFHSWDRCAEQTLATYEAVLREKSSR